MAERLPSDSSFSPSTSPAAPRSHPPNPHGNSTEYTLSLSAESSPTIVVNLSQKYARILQANSFRDMWSRIHPITGPHQLELEQVLDQHPVCVEGALREANSNPLTILIKAYINHTEKAAHLCLNLHCSVYGARALYADLNSFLHVLTLDSDSNSSFLTQSQCDRAFDLFLEFNLPDNPFACPQPHSFDLLPQMRLCAFQLKQRLHPALRKSRFRLRLHRCWGCCFCCSLGHSEEITPVVQSAGALSSTIFLNEELSTLDCLVRRLCSAVDSDKSLIRMALEIGRKNHFITDVVNDLRNNHPNFLLLLQELEEHLCICFISINKARAMLLQEIHLHHACGRKSEHDFVKRFTPDCLSGHGSSDDVLKEVMYAISGQSSWSSQAVKQQNHLILTQTRAWSNGYGIVGIVNSISSLKHGRQKSSCI